VFKDKGDHLLEWTTRKGRKTSIPCATREQAETLKKQYEERFGFSITIRTRVKG
jgi:hypothetical protein